MAYNHGKGYDVRGRLIPTPSPVSPVSCSPNSDGDAPPILSPIPPLEINDGENYDAQILPPTLTPMTSTTAITSQGTSDGDTSASTDLYGRLYNRWLTPPRPTFHSTSSDSSPSDTSPPTSPSSNQNSTISIIDFSPPVSPQVSPARHAARSPPPSPLASPHRSPHGSPPQSPPDSPLIPGVPGIDREHPLWARAAARTSQWGQRTSSDNMQDITVDDLSNVYNFYTVLLSRPKDFVTWLQGHGLYPTVLYCEACGERPKWQNRKDKIDLGQWKCTNRHTTCARKYTIFYGSHMYSQDILHFIYRYGEGQSLAKCALSSGINYRGTACMWAKDLRETVIAKWLMGFLHHVENVDQLRGEVEIDEAVFGRRVKFHVGNPFKGMKVWILGLIERQTNRVLLFPIDDRAGDTLTDIIVRFVAPGTTIYTDGWRGYNRLNDLGFEHFSVIHKHGFSVTYYNPVTRRVVKCHTNRMEGKWAHAKLFFKVMNGTSTYNFEGHLGEILWRFNTPKPHETALLHLITETYNLDRFPDFDDIPYPLFDTWTHINGGPVVDDDESDEDGNIYVDESSDDDDDDAPPQAGQGPADGGNGDNGDEDRQPESDMGDEGEEEGDGEEEVAVRNVPSDGGDESGDERGEPDNDGHGGENDQHDGHNAKEDLADKPVQREGTDGNYDLDGHEPDEDVDAVHIADDDDSHHSQSPTPSLEESRHHKSVAYPCAAEFSNSRVTYHQALKILASDTESSSTTSSPIQVLQCINDQAPLSTAIGHRSEYHDDNEDGDEISVIFETQRSTHSTEYSSQRYAKGNGTEIAGYFEVEEEATVLAEPPRPTRKKPPMTRINAKTGRNTPTTVIEIETEIKEEVPAKWNSSLSSKTIYIESDTSLHETNTDTLPDILPPARRLSKLSLNNEKKRYILDRPTGKKTDNAKGSGSNKEKEKEQEMRLLPKRTKRKRTDQPAHVMMNKSATKLRKPDSNSDSDFEPPKKVSRLFPDQKKLPKGQEKRAMDMDLGEDGNYINVMETDLPTHQCDKWMSTATSSSYSAAYTYSTNPDVYRQIQAREQMEKHKKETLKETLTSMWADYSQTGDAAQYKRIQREVEMVARKSAATTAIASTICSSSTPVSASLSFSSTSSSKYFMNKVDRRPERQSRPATSTATSSSVYTEDIPKKSTKQSFSKMSTQLSTPSSGQSSEIAASASIGHEEQIDKSCYESLQDGIQLMLSSTGNSLHSPLSEVICQEDIDMEQIEMAAAIEIEEQIKTDDKAIKCSIHYDMNDVADQHIRAADEHLHSQGCFDIVTKATCDEYEDITKEDFIPFIHTQATKEQDGAEHAQEKAALEEDVVMSYMDSEGTASLKCHSNLFTETLAKRMVLRPELFRKTSSRWQQVDSPINSLFLSIPLEERTKEKQKRQYVKKTKMDKKLSDMSTSEKNEFKRVSNAQHVRARLKEERLMERSIQKSAMTSYTQTNSKIRHTGTGETPYTGSISKVLDTSHMNEGPPQKICQENEGKTPIENMPKDSTKNVTVSEFILSSKERTKQLWANTAKNRSIQQSLINAEIDCVFLDSDEIHLDDETEKVIHQIEDQYSEESRALREAKSAQTMADSAKCLALQLKVDKKLSTISEARSKRRQRLALAMLDHQKEMHSFNDRVAHEKQEHKMIREGKKKKIEEAKGERNHLQQTQVEVKMQEVKGLGKSKKYITSKDKSTKKIAMPTIQEEQSEEQEQDAQDAQNEDGNEDVSFTINTRTGPKFTGRGRGGKSRPHNSLRGRGGRGRGKKRDPKKAVGTHPPGWEAPILRKKNKIDK